MLASGDFGELSHFAYGARLIERARAGDHAGAFALLTTMSEAGVPPDVFAHNAALDASACGSMGRGGAAFRGHAQLGPTAKWLLVPRRHPSAWKRPAVAAGAGAAGADATRRARRRREGVRSRDRRVQSVGRVAARSRSSEGDARRRRRSGPRLLRRCALCLPPRA